MKSSSPTTESGFRRQVCFRLGRDEWPLLEAAIRAHGGIQAALIAALRTHAAKLLDDQLRIVSEPAEPARAAGPRRPPIADHHPRASARVARDPDIRGDDLVELNLAEAAPGLGIKPASLRKQIKSGRRPGRQGTNGYWLARLRASELRGRDVVLSARGAAEVLGVTTATVNRRCAAGRYPHARREASGWRVPVDDLL